MLAENNVGKAASAWVMQRTGEAIPNFTPTPVVKAISSQELSVEWTAPTIEESRGAIVVYLLYFLKETNLTVDPYAPPAVWTVS